MHKKLLVTELIDYVLKIASKDNINDNTPMLQPSIIDDKKFNKAPYKESRSVSEFPPTLKTIFDPFITLIERRGVFDNNDIKNTSLYYSILFCIFNKFEEIDEITQLDYIDKFQTKLIRDLHMYDLFDKYNYHSIGWKKQSLITSLREYKNNKMVIRYLADYLFINIFILDVNNDSIYAVCTDSILDIYKITIFIVYNDGIYEPIMCDKKKLFTFNDNLCKKLFNVDFPFIHQFDDNIINPIISTKIIPINNQQDVKYSPNVEHLRFLKLIEPKIDIPITNDICNDTPDNCYKEIDDSNATDDVTNSTFTQTEPLQLINTSTIFCKKIDKLNLKNLQKLKLQELQELAKENNIPIYDVNKNGKQKNKTKNQIIELLLINYR